MKKIVLAFVLAVGVVALAGCEAKQQNSSESTSSSSSEASSSSSAEENKNSSVSESSSESKSEASSSSEEISESSSSSESDEGIHISTEPVPAWGINDTTEGEKNTFMVGCEYETYRTLRIAEFESGALKEMKVRVYVISEEFDMNSFKEKWGFEPVRSGDFYESAVAVPEEYAGKTVEEIKLAIAEPILKKYGAETLDGFPEIVMVDPTTVPDPAIEF